MYIQPVLEVLKGVMSVLVIRIVPHVRVDISFMEIYVGSVQSTVLPVSPLLMILPRLSAKLVREHTNLMGLIISAIFVSLGVMAAPVRIVVMIVW